MVYNYALVFLAFWYFGFASAEPPTIQTENGPVGGIDERTHDKKPFYSYMGIPYAEPPVGNLRFQDPQPLSTNWTEVRKADNFSSGCICYDNIAHYMDASGKEQYKVTGSEDCLYLNVFTSKQNLDEQGKDVIVFIHGGGFEFGSTDTFQAHAIMDRSGIVLVSIAYRLGVMGFLATGDEILGGNMGLKDQVAALQWVQRNIAKFGGDPKKVTLTGMSAGGVSVQMMYMSPLAKGLFSKGISHSGTALSPWAMVSDLPTTCKKLAQILDCPTKSQDMINCLREKDASELISATRHFQVYFYNPFTVFGPTVDSSSTNPFLPKHPLEYLKSGDMLNAPWMTTVTSGEGLYAASEYLSKNAPDRLSYINSNWEALAPSILFFNHTVPEDMLDKVSQDVRKAFMGDKALTPDTIPQYIQMLTDRNYVNGAVKSATYMAHSNTPRSKSSTKGFWDSLTSWLHPTQEEPGDTGREVYMSELEYRGTFSTSDIFSIDHDAGQFGVGHADDVLYLYDTPHLHVNIAPKDRAIGKLLLDIEESFVKTSKPPSRLEWKPFAPKDGKYNYLEIKSPKKIKMVTNSKIGSVEILSKIFEPVENFKGASR